MCRGIIHPLIVSCHTYVTASLCIINTSFLNDGVSPTLRISQGSPIMAFILGPVTSGVSPAPLPTMPPWGPIRVRCCKVSTSPLPATHPPSTTQARTTLRAQVCMAYFVVDVLLLTPIYSYVFGNTPSFFLISNVHKYPSMWVHCMLRVVVLPYFFKSKNPSMCIHSCTAGLSTKKSVLPINKMT